jgi:hypothetical protein
LLHAAIDIQLIHTGYNFEPIIGACLKTDWSVSFS